MRLFPVGQPTAAARGDLAGSVGWHFIRWLILIAQPAYLFFSHKHTLIPRGGFLERFRG